MEVAEAYRVCRQIARREAKNFYYSFVALPARKRDAICAVYAFMRRADDLSDDESLSREERQLRLGEWLAQWREAAGGSATQDPAFVALRDAQRKFEIPSELLEQLVEGTTMDLRRAECIQDIDPPAYDSYATFDDLYRYCYLVASVVGLVCIRIFEYEKGSDGGAQAERLAEETGIAFQLTNILRDVREDAERRRIYLPREDLQRFGVEPEELIWTLDGGRPSEAMQKLLSFEARRAESYYESGTKLLPLISADSRPAMWVLTTIYHRLLRRIESSEYAVFSKRVSVPAYEKLAILGWGILRVLGNRMLLRG